MRRARLLFLARAMHYFPVHSGRPVATHDFNPMPLDIADAASSEDAARIVTVRLQSAGKKVNYDEENGHIVAKRDNDIKLWLYGVGLGGESVRVRLATAEAKFGQECPSEGWHSADQTISGEKLGGIKFGLSVSSADLAGVGADEGSELRLFFCLSTNGDAGPFIHQGTDTDAFVVVEDELMPAWVIILIIIILLILSGIFSGLNLGLMALDQTELKIVQNTGTEAERGYADKIAPVRKHGNFLLCSLLLGNVIVNTTQTVLFDGLTSGMTAVIGSSLGIVIFGEIIPQAICSRHGLAVGAHTLWLTKFFMLLTFPLSYPISLILDKVLGTEIGTVYDKKKLIELLRVTEAEHDLGREEVDIVTGALVYKDKKVKDVMTKLEDIYMLQLDSVLDFETISEIREQGYSRIPVFNGEFNNIVHIMFAKDLMFVDPDDRMPLSTVCEFYQNDVNFVFHDTSLAVMFNEFKSGEKGHMAFVQDVINNEDGDPFYQTIGLITLEDIIEEIIQQEIVDETDVVADNRTKRRLKRGGWHGKEGNFLNEERARKVFVSAQLSLAVFQYLTTSLEPFKTPHMNEWVLKKLLALDIFREVKVKKDKTKMKDEELTIILKDKPMDHFILILEGRVEVKIGSEGLMFESGPFSFFGIQSLVAIMEDFKSATTPAPTSLVSPVAKAMATSFNIMASATSDGSTSPTSMQGGNRRASVRKTPATPESAQSHHPLLSKRGSVVEDFSKLLPPSFVPDYTVKAASDVLYMRIKRGTYIAALRASQMQKKQSTLHGDIGDIDRFLERADELASAGDRPADVAAAVMMRSPTLRHTPTGSRHGSPKVGPKRTDSFRRGKTAEKPHPISASTNEPSPLVTAERTQSGHDGETMSLEPLLTKEKEDENEDGEPAS